MADEKVARTHPRAKRTPVVPGARYGRLVVSHEVPRPAHLTAMCKHWWVRCDCGAEKRVLDQALKTGATTSCGCYAREVAAGINRKHGESHSAEYGAWVSMIQRCTDVDGSSWRLYGGRGIKVSERWLGPDGFANFLADLGRKPTPEHSTDRHPDVDGDYRPGNVRWATAQQQANNRRDNRLIEHDGVVLTLTQWAAKAGMTPERLRYRLDQNWPMAEALVGGRHAGHRFYDVDGETLSLPQMAARCGIPRHTLYRRIVIHGWPPKTAMTTPVSASNSHLCAGHGRLKRVPKRRG